jgi:hypothetical protein
VIKNTVGKKAILMFIKISLLIMSLMHIAYLMFTMTLGALPSAGADIHFFLAPTVFLIGGPISIIALALSVYWSKPRNFNKEGNRIFYIFTTIHGLYTIWFIIAIIYGIFGGRLLS